MISFPACLPILGLMGAMMLWGSSFIAMKVALRHYDPVVVMCGRLAIAAIVFVLFYKRFGRIEYRRGDWKLLAFMAFCEPCLYFCFEIHALRWTSASEAATITALLPALTVVGARVFLSERLTVRSLLGLCASAVGVLALTGFARPSEHAPCSWLGNALEFAAMIFAAGYTLSSRLLAARYGPFFLTAVQAFVGSAFFLAAVPVSGASIVLAGGWQPAVAVLYLGIGVNVLAYFFYNYGLSRIPASQVSLFVNLIPVCSMLLGWMLLGEVLTSMQYLAAGLVLGGAMAGQGRVSQTT